MEQQLNQLSPQQRQQVMMQAQQEANQQIMQGMLEKMAATCFTKCVGTSGSKLDSREQSCMAHCQDRYFDVRERVQAALQNRQNSM
mmetsp:Transcript_18871/g.27579  ORF Transcript_18871/g.27579 Transcript_18871/m.27579 type:complete len:86 (-) Transcript_18871:239-496(-)|eukprot:CAMPEP_0197236098 /NCGR_PEP_ID=MMETSP1429-20130617/3348_1 /TAXON_ID=49237 /ORGANISM="Chaetoceros  sp., Strain UNC1202" /LENGTH=85 /DNA_ID=CAMNT_0042694843 /DNA_START=70 /DNA_END=327 /DNA_ORIENTATION=-